MHLLSFKLSNLIAQLLSKHSDLLIDSGFLWGSWLILLDDNEKLGVLKFYGPIEKRLILRDQKYLLSDLEILNAVLNFLKGGSHDGN